MLYVCIVISCNGSNFDVSMYQGGCSWVSGISAGGNTDTLSPKKKKRRKHHEQPTPAPASTATASQLPVNVQSRAHQAGSALANGSAAPLPGTVTHSPAAGGAPVQSQAPASSMQKLPELQADTILLQGPDYYSVCSCMLLCQGLMKHICSTRHCKVAAALTPMP